MVAFCPCQDEAEVLIASGLWPVSPVKPTVAYNMALLKELLSLQMECHVSLKGFFNSLKWRNWRNYKYCVSIPST